MLRGIAKAGDDDQPEERYANVVALSQLSKAIADATGDEAYGAAAEATATLLRVPNVVVFVRRDGDVLRVAGSRGVEGDSMAISAAAEYACAALSSASPLVHPNIPAETTPAARALAAAGVVSLVSAPMRVGEASVGVIVAMSDSLRAFSPSDIGVLHVIASQTGLAAYRPGASTPPAATSPENQEDLIKLAQRKIHELSLINQVSHAVASTLDLDKLLDISLEQSIAAVGADGGSLMLISEETGRLEITASRGLKGRWIQTTSQPVGLSIAGWVAENGESVLVTNAHDDPRFQMITFRDDITSSASVPLRAKSGVIGVLNVHTLKSGAAFDNRDLELLETVANQMAVAIDNARLYARVNRRTIQLDSLLQISKTVTSTLNLDEVLRRLSEEISGLFGLDVCVLLLADELSGRLRFGYGHGLKTRRKSAYYDLAAPLASHAKRTGRKVLLKNVCASRAFATEMAAAEGLKSALSLPLKNRGAVVAVAVGFSTQAGMLPRSQRDILKPLGDLAGVAIHNARVYRRQYRMAEILQQGLTPSSIPQIEGIEIGHKFLPARDVGGDYFDFIPVDAGRMGVVVGDVAGSDVEAAEYTTMGKHVLRAYAREYESPADVLVKTNDLVCDDTRAEMFISLFYGVVDVGRRKLRYANAGCEPALLYRASDATVRVLTSGGILLGIRRAMTFDEQEVDLEPGDVIVLHTDGLTEASAGSDRFGREAVMHRLAASAHLDAQRIADSIHDSLVEFVHGRITDDVAMVVLKFPQP